MRYIFVLISVIITLIAIPPLFLLVGIYILVTEGRTFITRIKFDLLFVDIAMTLPAVWVTVNEVRDNIHKKYAQELIELENAPGIDEVIGVYKKRPSKENMARCENIVDCLILELFRECSSYCPIRDLAYTYFHPTADGLMLCETGDTKIGRMFALPSKALDDEDNEKAMSGSSIEIGFIKKKSGGKKTPPKQQESAVRDNTPGILTPQET